MVAVIKPKLKYDDTLDAFGVHGVGGIIGSILTGVFATRFITGEEGAEGALYGDWHQGCGYPPLPGNAASTWHTT